MRDSESQKQRFFAMTCGMIMTEGAFENLPTGYRNAPVWTLCI
jgi:hypothetical protein